MLINSEEKSKTGNIIAGTSCRISDAQIALWSGSCVYAHTVLFISVRLRDSILLFQITSQITRSLLPLSSTLGVGGRSYRFYLVWKYPTTPAPKFPFLFFAKIWYGQGAPGH